MAFKHVGCDRLFLFQTGVRVEWRVGRGSVPSGLGRRSMSDREGHPGSRVSLNRPDGTGGPRPSPETGPHLFPSRPGEEKREGEVRVSSSCSCSASGLCSRYSGTTPTRSPRTWNGGYDVSVDGGSTLPPSESEGPGDGTCFPGPVRGNVGGT